MLSTLRPRISVLALLAALGFLAGPGIGAARADDPPANPKDGDKPSDKPSDKPKDDKPADGEKKKEEPAKAPDFTLKDLDGKERKLSEFVGKWVVLEWMNFKCPYVKKHYAKGDMQALQKKYTDKGVIWLSICSSADGKEGFLSVEDWKKAVAEKKAVPTALLPDADGKVGHLYNARTTPDMRIVDPKGNLVYTGAIDDTKDAKADPAKCKNYVAEALDAALAGKPLPTPSTTSYG